MKYQICGRVKVVALAAVAALIPLMPTAQASTGTGAGEGLRVESFMRPAGARLPSLEDLQAEGGYEAFKREVAGDPDRDAVGPMETVGPAARYGRLSSRPSASEPVPQLVRGPSGVSWPEPSHTMTAAECRKGLGSDKKFFSKSRFTMCSGASFTQIWLKDNEPVGESQFVMLSVGTVAKSSRTMKVQHYFTDLTKTSETVTSGLMITRRSRFRRSGRPQLSTTRAAAFQGRRASMRSRASIRPPSSTPWSSIPSRARAGTTWCSRSTSPRSR
ncbi:hypothetical protein [Wenjunlia tyrosinilytica]|uniref:Uncharacterized protein n=1 Tax=Wenjunlia tyrosinilytica TaxID=1544741 RepID=A0A918E0J4_9ACTN|nr:hypothetical protein [Wenjunlia tyrosinilytica]GGO98745.1 hypothetical protein GCM10012280_63600 [Wenjunlia tyrosinilytica]